MNRIKRGTRRVGGRIGGLAAAGALVASVLTGGGPPAGAGGSGGGTAPNTIYAGVQYYQGGWRGTGSSCKWAQHNVVPNANPVRPVYKTENGIKYQLYDRRCPGSGLQYVWIPLIDTRRLSYTATAYVERLLPPPDATFAPPRTKGVVTVGQWFWIDASDWRSFSVTAWIPTPTGARWTTTTARPVQLLFDPGDGGRGTGSVRCTGPGTRWRTADGDIRSSPSGCEYRYRHSSAMAPNGSTFPARVTIVWDVSWRSSSGASGYSGQLRTSSGYSMTVREVQALVVAI
jgi:hypothetical protein